MSYLTCYSPQCSFVYSLLRAAVMHLTTEQILLCNEAGLPLTFHFNIKSLSNLRCACRCAAPRPVHTTFNQTTMCHCTIIFNVKPSMVSFLYWAEPDNWCSVFMTEGLLCIDALPYC